MTTKQMEKPPRRNKLIISAEIINKAKVDALKTQIIHKAHLNFNQLNQPLKLLMATKILAKTKNNDKEVYNLTQKSTQKVEDLTRHEQLRCLIKRNHRGLQAAFNLDSVKGGT
ncbi:MAG: winged helix-turn-helix domain-containing protein [Candidatus Bathyarchaeota archaeon]|nr:winged helix-turn-helix domain-containing protein [Candidatus Bathyarchaeota archaeon]